MDKTKTLSLKDKSEIATSWIGVIFVVVGGCIAIGTYVAAIRTQVTDQEKESIAFFRTYNEKDMITLRDQFEAIKKEAFTKVDVGKAVSLEQVDSLEKQIQDTANSLIEERNHGLEMRRLVEYFDSLSQCIDINICEENAAKRLFHEEAYDIKYVLASFINSVQKLRPTFANGLAKLALYRCRAAKGQRIRS